MSHFWALNQAEGIAIRVAAISEASARVAGGREGISNSPDRI